MSIENISRITSKNIKNKTYLFDLPTLEDEDAKVSYLLMINKNNIEIKKITDFNEFLNELKNFKVKKIKVDSRRYIMFLNLLGLYLKETTYNSSLNENNIITKEDENLIKRHFKEEILLYKYKKEEKNK